MICSLKCVTFVLKKYNYFCSVVMYETDGLYDIARIPCLAINLLSNLYKINIQLDKALDGQKKLEEFFKRYEKSFRPL